MIRRRIITKIGFTMIIALIGKVKIITKETMAVVTVIIINTKIKKLKMVRRETKPKTRMRSKIEV